MVGAWATLNARGPRFVPARMTGLIGGPFEMRETTLMNLGDPSERPDVLSVLLGFVAHTFQIPTDQLEIHRKGFVPSSKRLNAFINAHSSNISLQCAGSDGFSVTFSRSPRSRVSFVAPTKRRSRTPGSSSFALLDRKS